ncbi:hypothetical protein F2P79_007383 [Pimephales promelas]|nr:hypothetical protein F2P79_007383 [Pimephales promelas]
MAAARYLSDVYGHDTTYSNPFMSLTNAEDNKEGTVKAHEHMTVKHGHFPLGRPSPSSPKHKSHSAARQPPLSDSDEDYNSKERVPTLRPGQYDGSTPWREFLHRFESCAEANHWSVKTMAIQLKFCLTGAAGAIVHRNPRSSKWDYRPAGGTRNCLWPFFRSCSGCSSRAEAKSA